FLDGFHERARLRADGAILHVDDQQRRTLAETGAAAEARRAIGLLLALRNDAVPGIHRACSPFWQGSSALARALLVLHDDQEDPDRHRPHDAESNGETQGLYLEAGTKVGLRASNTRKKPLLHRSYVVSDRQQIGPGCKLRHDEVSDCLRVRRFGP